MGTLAQVRDQKHNAMDDLASLRFEVCILIAAGLGQSSSTEDWIKLAVVVAGALGASFVVFSWAARSRT